MPNLLIYLNFVVPIIVKIIIPDGRYGLLPIIITDIIMLPITLAILNIFALAKRIETSYVKCFSFMLLGLLLGEFTGYTIWGISSKMFFRPDGETIWIMKSLIGYQICFVLILFACTKASLGARKSLSK